MTILVKNEEKELRIYNNQDRTVDWASDLIGNYGDLRKNDDGQYVMTEEEFIFWENIEKMNNKILDLEDELNEYELDFYQDQEFDYDDRFIDEYYELKLKFLEKLISDREARSENVRKLVKKLNETLNNSENSVEECFRILETEGFDLTESVESEENDCNCIHDDYFCDDFGNRIGFVRFFNKNEDSDDFIEFSGEIVKQYFEIIE